MRWYHGCWVVVALAGCGEREVSDDGGSAAGVPAVVRSWATKDWPMARGGAELQGRVADPVLVRPEVSWTFDAGREITAGAAIAGGVVVFGDQGGRIRAIDLTKRELRWTVEAGDAVDAAPAISGGRVFIGAHDKLFRALEMANGGEIWRIEGKSEFPTGASVVPESAEMPERVLVNGYDGITRCLRARDGAEVWRFETESYLAGTPALVGGEWVAYGGCDTLIRALRLSTGEAALGLEVDAEVTTTVASYEGVVFACSYGDEVVAVDVLEGKRKWVYEAEGLGFGTPPGVDEAAVYIGGADKQMHAIDRETGKGLWTFKTGGEIGSAPLVFDDAVVFGAGDGRVYALEKRSGREIWRLDLGEGVAADPAFADGRLVIGGEDGTLFVIEEGGEMIIEK